MEEKYTIDGIEITRHYGFSYIGFKADWMESGDGWFFQEHEADKVIDEIEQYANANNISEREAAVWWAKHYLY